MPNSTECELLSCSIAVITGREIASFLPTDPCEEAEEIHDGGTEALWLSNAAKMESEEEKVQPI